MISNYVIMTVSDIAVPLFLFVQDSSSTHAPPIIIPPRNELTVLGTRILKIPVAVIALH